MVYADNQSSTSSDQQSTMPAVSTPATTNNSATDQPSEAEAPIIKKEKSRTAYGLTVGIFTPLDSTVKDVFGDSWIRYGIRPIPANLPNTWRPGFDVSYYSMSNGPDKVTIVPVTGGFIRGFAKDNDEKKKTRNYLAINAGPYYCDLNSPTLGKSKTGWGLNANITYGLTFKDRWSLEARYETMSKFQGLDFSAFTVSASFKVFTARL
jgi:hypothetical protein